MGLFVMQNKPDDECSVEEFVNLAEQNIQLWKEHPNCDYLLSTFATFYLEKAANKIKSAEKKNV
jgi:hypothetical protein